MKKLISFLLSVVMIFSLSSTAFAASSSGAEKFAEEIISNVSTTKDSIKSIAKLSMQAADRLQPVVMDFVLDSKNWEKGADAIMKVITKVFDKLSPNKPDSPETPENPEKPDEPNVPGITDVLKSMTIEEMVNFFKKYFVINVEDIDATSSEIAEISEYKYVTEEDGKTTVYIVVDLEKHPELLNRDLLMETTKKLYEKQNEEFDEKADILMSYEHIAGELAMHAILYAVTNEYLEISGATEGTIYNLWVRAKMVDLNYDEDRVPPEFIQILGTYIVGVFIASYYTVYKAFKK